MFKNYKYRYSNLPDIQIERQLYSDILDALHARYGPEPDTVIKERIEKEWDAIKRTDTVADIAFLNEFTSWMRKEHYAYHVRPGGSLILYLLEITLANPLKAHYYCPNCHKVLWEEEPDGFDLAEPDLYWLMDEENRDHRACICGSMHVICDGHDIPHEMFFGAVEHFFPYIQIFVPTDMEITFKEFINGHWLTYRFDAQPITKVIGGIHKEAFLHINCFFNYPNEKLPSSYYSIKIDNKIRDFALSSWRQLMSGDVIPYDLPAPHTFGELIANYCLIHSTGLWDEKSKYMVENMDCSTVSLLYCMEDIFNYYCKHGYTPKEAWLVMRGVRFGCVGDYYTDHTTEMIYAKDTWILDRINQRNMVIWSKANSVEMILYHLRELNMQEVGK